MARDQVDEEGRVFREKESRMVQKVTYGSILVEP